MRFWLCINSEQGSGRRQGHPPAALGIRQLAQIGGKCSSITPTLAQIPQMRLGGDLGDHFARQCPSLCQLARQPEHIVPGAHALMRAQRQAQCGKMATLLAAQPGQCFQRGVKASLFVGHFSLEHQGCCLGRRIVVTGMRQPVLLFLGFTQALRRTRRDQRRQARCCSCSMRLCGLFQGMAEAAFKEQANRLLENLGGLRALALRPILPDANRQPGGHDAKSDQRI